MKHKFRTIVLICSILLVAIACNIDNGGHTINFSGDETPAGIQEFVPGAPPIILTVKLKIILRLKSPKRHHSLKTNLKYRKIQIM